jgi:hypothetical protein
VKSFSPITLFSDGVCLFGDDEWCGCDDSFSCEEPLPTRCNSSSSELAKSTSHSVSVSLSSWSLASWSSFSEPGVFFTILSFLSSNRSARNVPRERLPNPRDGCDGDGEKTGRLWEVYLESQSREATVMNVSRFPGGLTAVEGEEEGSGIRVSGRGAGGGCIIARLFRGGECVGCGVGGGVGRGGGGGN